MNDCKEICGSDIYILDIYIFPWSSEDEVSECLLDHVICVEVLSTVNLLINLPVLTIFWHNE